MLVDAHTHLDRYLHKRFGANITPILEQIEKHEILTISNSLDLTSYKTSKRIAKQSKFVVPAFGIHPWNAYKYVNKIGLIKRLVRRNNIIGEIGLDYHLIRDKRKYPSQRKIFRLFLSETREKVISVQTKGAGKDVLDLLRRYGSKRVIIHWYSGSFDVLEEMIGEGYYFSISPEIGFSKHIREIVKKIPFKQILTETDNPGVLKAI